MDSIQYIVVRIFSLFLLCVRVATSMPLREEVDLLQSISFPQLADRRI
ncbi:MAG: hypothetical protein J6Q52_03220 [Clostridia bacterium]|nr:hypothetical protein [Clostridia bacterium]